MRIFKNNNECGRSERAGAGGCLDSCSRHISRDSVRVPARAVQAVPGAQPRPPTPLRNGGWHVATDPASSALGRSEPFHGSNGPCGGASPRRSGPLALKQRRQRVGPCEWEPAAGLAVAGARPTPAFAQDLAGQEGTGTPRHSRRHEGERPQTGPRCREKLSCPRGGCPGNDQTN